MVGIDIQYRLRNYIADVQDQGILNRRFELVMNRRGPETPDHVLDSIDRFIFSTRNRINELYR
ncbi:hypothetical protein LINGRAHAP2_LOCUS33243, partial [Linum grandiflorum]